MSLTISSIAALIILRFLAWADTPAIDENAILNFVFVGAQILSGIGIWYGRYRKGDITFYGKRKPKE